VLGGEESTVYKLSSTVSLCDGVQEENKFVSGLQLRWLMAVADWLVQKSQVFLQHTSVFFVDKHYFLETKMVM